MDGVFSMWKKHVPETPLIHADTQEHEYKELLDYVNQLAAHKLGYPVSLLTFLGILDNQILGIKPNSLANILLNNVGDPFKDSETSLMEVKKHERMLIAILEKFYGLGPDQARGYVTTGGTEGNFASLWWSKRYLISYALPQLIKFDDFIKTQTREEQSLLVALTKIPMNAYKERAEVLQKIIDIRTAINDNKNIVQQLLTPTVFFSKGHTHYSVPKISEILRLNIKAILPNPDGSISLENFKKEVLLHLGAHPYSSIIVIANIGTTITGAIDDIPGIKKILESFPSKPKYTIHMDGALTGFVMPILKPFGEEVTNYFDDLGVNTLAVSAHKYPGLSQPCGIVLAKKEFFERAFEKSERSIDYVGNILDVTITGSRSGLNVLMFYNALFTLGLHKNTDKLKKMVDNNLEMARYLRDELVKLYGPEKVSYPFHFNVIFPRPSVAIAKKYQLMLTGDNATICVLTNVSKKLVDQFIQDLKAEKEEAMTTVTKTAYTTKTLTKEHLESAVELFTRSFCDSEPITKHLKISYSDYEPFVRDVMKKALQDGMSVVALDKTNKVIACAIAEDIANPFTPDVDKYPKMKPVFALLNELDKPFFRGKHFTRGKIAHIWIAVVDSTYRGKGLSTVIDTACADLAVSKGYDFAYAEFTNEISSNITHHYSIYQLCNTIKYDDFRLEQNQKPFKGVTGGASAYIIGIRPGVKLDSLKKCYTMEESQH